MTTAQRRAVLDKYDNAAALYKNEKLINEDVADENFIETVKRITGADTYSEALDIIDELENEFDPQESPILSQAI